MRPEGVPPSEEAPDPGENALDPRVAARDAETRKPLMTETHPWRKAPPGDYAVVGDPVAHSKSPAMHAAAYRALGLDLTYRAIHIPRGELGEALDHLKTLGYRGVNCTVPHKEAALEWAVSPDREAREAGAANTLNLVSRRATNTDILGFHLSFDWEPRGRRTLILGAGGSAAAVLLALLRLAERGGISIWNRNPERAAALLRNTAERLEPRIPADPVACLATSSDPLLTGQSPGRSKEEIRRRNLFKRANVVSTPDLATYDLIVNATAASLKGENLGLDWSRAKPNALAYDLAYGVDEAPFLRGAREAGLRTRDGRAMLAAQGALAVVWWGLPLRLNPPGIRENVLRRIMREALD